MGTVVSLIWLIKLQNDVICIKEKPMKECYDRF